MHELEFRCEQKEAALDRAHSELQSALRSKEQACQLLKAQHEQDLERLKEES